MIPQDAAATGETEAEPTDPDASVPSAPSEPLPSEVGGGGAGVPAHPEQTATEGEV